MVNSKQLAGTEFKTGDGQYLFQYQAGQTNLTDVTGLQFRTYIQNLFAASSLHYQYIYDFVKDLAQAHNELYDELACLESECCPNDQQFPLHLMLGLINDPPNMPTGKYIAPEQAYREEFYRQGFIYTPIGNGSSVRLKRVQLFIERLRLMFAKFDIPLMQGSHDMRAVPGHGYNEQLANRVIPYYYNSNAETNKLYKYWNLSHSTLKHAVDSIPAPPAIVGEVNCYHRYNDPSLFFRKDILKYNFFRIEGHIGQPQDTMKANLEALRNNNNLPFDILSVRLSGAGSAENPCHFEDLQERYYFLRESMLALITDIQEGFNAYVKLDDKVLESVFKKGKTKPIVQDLKDLPKMLEDLREFLKAAPCLPDFDYANFRKAYKKLIKSYLDDILLYKHWLIIIGFIVASKVEQSKVAENVNMILNRLLKMFTRFIDNQWFMKLTEVWYVYQHRLTRIPPSMEIWSNFCAQNHGVEHMAGVPVGGTFIMLYQDHDHPNILADFTLPYRVHCDCHCDERCDPADKNPYRIPPFARPDFIIVEKDNKVTVDLLDDDYGVSDMTLEFFDLELLEEKFSNFNNGALSHAEFEKIIWIEKTAKGSTIHFDADDLPTGIYEFIYRVRYEEDNSLHDTGFLTVMVIEKQLIAPDITRDYKTSDQYLNITLPDTAGYHKNKPYQLDFTTPAGTRTYDGLTCHYIDTSMGGHAVAVNKPNEEPFIYYIGAWKEGEDKFNYLLKQDGQTDEAEISITVKKGFTLTGRDVRGKVYDTRKRPVKNVYVKNLNTGDTVYTNSRGEYKIPVNGPDDKIVFERPGFDTSETGITSADAMNMEMTENPNTAGSMTVFKMRNMLSR